MNERKLMGSSLVKRWGDFFTLILDPWTLILIAVAAFLSKTLVTQEDIGVAATLTLIVSLVSGVIGGILMLHWTKMNDEGAMKARGQTAVRSLQLLLVGIAQLEKRATTYLERLSNHEESDKETTKAYFEEIAGRCTILQESTLSSIQNWMDLVPEADIKSQIGAITDSIEEAKELRIEINRLKADLENAKDNSKTEASKLGNEIRQKELELSKLRKLVGEQSIVLGGSLLTPTYANSQFLPLFDADSTQYLVKNFEVPPYSVNVPSTFFNTCPNCNETLITKSETCPKCGEEIRSND